MNREQGRAVVLTAIMVVSVFGMGFAFAGGAAASDVDRNDTPDGGVEQGNTTEVLDFNLTSEDQVLEGDGDVNPGDSLRRPAPNNFSYVDDNGNQSFEADETLIQDGLGIPGQTGNDTFDNQSEIRLYPDGAFRPYLFGDDVFFTDVDDAGTDRGNYTGEDFTDDGNITREAILRTDQNGTDSWEIDENTSVLTTGQANLTGFQASDESDLFLHDQDGQNDGQYEFNPEEDPLDYLFVNNDDDAEYNASTDDTVVAGNPPGAGTVESNTVSIAGTDVGERIFFLDFNQTGEFNATEGDGAEPLVRLTDGDNIGSTETGDALPNTAVFIDPAQADAVGDSGINDNYYEQHDEGSNTYENNADDRDDDTETSDVGLQGMNSTDTLFLDVGIPEQDYLGEDGDDEDVVENNLSTGSFPPVNNSNVLVDGALTNANGEDIGPNADDDGTPSEEPDDAVIRQPENLFTEDDGDGFANELVIANEIADCVNEGSDAYIPGYKEDDGGSINRADCLPGVVDDPPDVIKYGDALVDLTVANTATADEDSDLDGANLIRENDSVSGPSEGDEVVQSTTFDTSASTGGGVSEEGQFVFENRTQLFGNESTDDSARFYITVGIQDNADTGETLQFGIPQFRDRADDSGNEEDAFDLDPEPDDDDLPETGLFLESDEDFSTGPYTNSDGNKAGDTGYYNTRGPIVTEQTLTIVSDESGPAPGEITTSDQSFGSVDVGDSTTRTVSVLNEGGQSVQVDSTTINGADAGDFAVTGGGAPFTLAPGENKEVTVEFAPSSDGAKNADLDIATANANSVSAALSGTGEDSGGGGGGEGGNADHVITFEGTGEAANYVFSVKDDLQKSTANGANINSNDEVRREYVGDGQVGVSRDSYTYNGTLQTIDAPDSVNVYVDGNQLSDDRIDDERNNVIEFEGTGSLAEYDFAATDGNERIQKVVSNNANINNGDEIFRTTGYGEVGVSKDAYGFNGVIDSLEVESGNANVYVNGRQVDPANEQDNTITIVGTGDTANYEFTLDESSLAPSNANYANTNSNDEIDGDTKTGQVGIGADSNDYNGDITSFSADADVDVYVDGEPIDEDDVASEA